MKLEELERIIDAIPPGEGHLIEIHKDLLMKLINVAQAAKRQAEQVPTDPNYSTFELDWALAKLEK